MQHNLNGDEITKVVLETTTIIFQGDYFCLTVTEPGAEQLAKLKKSGQENTQWISTHMRVRHSLPDGIEGDCFQKDLERLKKELKKNKM